MESLAVFFGSETETAQEVAEYVASLAGRRGFAAAAVSLDSVPISQVMESSLAVFVVSTTGDGEVPSNMSTFWRFLLRRECRGLRGDCLETMTFAVFGLGDSGYAKYNATARKLHARLLQLGGVELVDRGLGDDQSPRGMWGDLDPWLVALWTRLLELKPLPSGAVIDDTPRLEKALFSMTALGTCSTDGSHAAEIAQGRREFWDSVAPPRPKKASHGDSCHGGGAPLPARLLVNRRLTAEGHFQDVRHLELDVSGVPGGKDYGAGDVAWVHPSNNASVVETLAVLMGLDLDQTVRIGPADGGGSGSGDGRDASTIPYQKPQQQQQQQQQQHLQLLHTQPPPPPPPFFLPPVSTLRLLLTEVLDISGTPRRSFFERLSLFSGDAEEKEKLEELASPAGADLLYEYATREKRSYVEVFGDFPSCKVPPERLLELIPRLRPRGFSIASSALETPSVVHICMAVVSFRTPYKRLRTGVCSSWLASLAPGAAAEVPLSIRRGTFKLPESPHHPLIMVGPGTGVAPMRGVILQRRRQRESLMLNQGTGNGVGGDQGGPVLSPQREGGGARGGVAAATAPDTLFFGCRYGMMCAWGEKCRSNKDDGLAGCHTIYLHRGGFREKDFFYEDDWATLSASGDLSLQTAFSRSNPDGTGSRVYVQRRIREQSAVVAGLVVDQGANVLVSGSAKQMPRDVREALRDALAGHEKVGGGDAAEKILKTMERQRRYCVEAWS
ncbi:unnamed protein product [Pylaiella littoralis]